MSAQMAFEYAAPELHDLKKTRFFTVLLQEITIDGEFPLHSMT